VAKKRTLNYKTCIQVSERLKAVFIELHLLSCNACEQQVVVAYQRMHLRDRLAVEVCSRKYSEDGAAIGGRMWRLTVLITLLCLFKIPFKFRAIIIGLGSG
jgi:hypothetical protein